MRRPFTLALFGTLCALTAFAQSECDGVRYRTPNLFPDVTVTNGIEFGSNLGLNGSQQTLRMDVYQPTGDTETSRPVVVMAFGGSFVGGTRSDVAFICREFARMGYVAIAPDYRVGVFIPNQLSTTLAVVRGAHDMKAAVRFLRRSVAEEGNPYGIDPERIILGGVSAGAISAIHGAYLDREEEIPAYMDSYVDGIGGIEGNSGNLGYSSRPMAVLSFSGTIGDTAWIEPGDLPIVSIHEDLDQTVPYGTQQVAVFGVNTGLIASGSRDIHTRARNLGIDNSLLTYPDNNNHCGYILGSIQPVVLDFVSTFCADIVCTGSSSLASGFVSVSETEAQGKGLGLYPNPTADNLRFHVPSDGVVEVTDMLGRNVLSVEVVHGEQNMDVRSLRAGSYVLRFVGGEVLMARFVRQ
jgi:para-nitrobenzyl esterase